MMKKLSRSLALLLALVTVFTLPASADDFSNDSWMNVLDYCYPNDEKGTSVYSSGTSCDISFELPGARSIYDVDMVVRVRPGSLSSVTTSGGTGLTVLDLGNHTYRIYGRYSNGGTVDKLKFTFVISSAGYIDFLSLDASHLNNSHFDEAGLFYLKIGDSSFIRYSMADVSTPVKSAGFGSGSTFQQYIMRLQLPNWRRYDFVDFLVHLDVNSIDSIHAVYEGGYLPIEVTGYNMSGVDGYTYYDDFSYSYEGDSEVNLNTSFKSDSYADYDGDTYVDDRVHESGNGSVTGGTYENGDGTITTDFNRVEVENEAYVMIRVDLRGLDRSSSDTPYVYICGTANQDNSSSVSLNKCSGYIEVTQLNPFITFFRVMRDSFSENMAALGDALSAKLKQLEASVTDWLETINGNVVNISRNMVAWFKTVNDTLTSGFTDMVERLDTLIGVGDEGDELSQGAEDLNGQFSNIQDYEESQQAVLDNNMPLIQEAVAITGFTASLAFVGKYINLAWDGIGDFSIIYTLPIFVGLFFFICGRIPGATRWRSRAPKDGDDK